MEIQQKLTILSDAIKKSLHEFHKTMCPLAVTDGEVIAGYDEAVIGGKYQAVGVISMSGEECNGSVSIHVRKDFGHKVAKSLLGMDNVSDSDVFDIVGEMANIIVGMTKTIATSCQLSFGISCPTVIRGDGGVAVEPPKNGQVILIPFKVDGHDLLVMVSVLG